MEKLKLDLDAFDVQTFETMTEPSRESGTVFGFNTYTPQESCHATYCGDCVTAECDDDNTYDCPSVNIADCQSAYYTACCGGDPGGFTRFTGDPWALTCS